jgi:hypothetical protein
MLRPTRSAFVALCVLFLSRQTAAGDIIGPAPIPERVAHARVIVVGKVTALEPRTLKMKPLWGGEPYEFMVAVVKVKEAILGAKGVTHVRVAFIPGGDGRRRPRTDLKVDEEVCLFLTAHEEQPVYLAPMYYDIIRDLNMSAKEIEEARRCAKLLSDPLASLKSKNAEDRGTTAAMLLLRYRSPGFGRLRPTKTEPISVEESKLILEALAEADWSKQIRFNTAYSYQQLFLLLGLTKDDGWTHPQTFPNFPEVAKKWLKENAGKYRIQRLVK